MTIPEDIIEKLELEATGIQTGNSFMNNCRLFRSGIFWISSAILFMECDLTGKPCKDIYLYNETYKIHGLITVEFLQDCNIKEIIAFLNTFK